MNNAVCSDSWFMCRSCGQPIVLVASDVGPAIADARAFLATHGRCLTARV